MKIPSLVSIAASLAMLSACGGAHDPNTGAGAPDGGTGSGSGSGTVCQQDSDCPSGETCQPDPADQGSEFPTMICVGGGSSAPCDPSTDPSCAVDPSCAMGGGQTYYPPYVPLVAPDVPASCANGFEINNSYPMVYKIKSSAAGGSRAISADIDIATYVQPNRITIRGIDANGQEYVLLDTCRMQTWDHADPTQPAGQSRPLDVTIRQFHIEVKQGTTQLMFDFSDPECSSPFYVRALGLCDFDLSTDPWAPNAANMPLWRAVQ